MFVIVCHSCLGHLAIPRHILPHFAWFVAIFPWQMAGFMEAPQRHGLLGLNHVERGAATLADSAKAVCHVPWHSMAIHGIPWHSMASCFIDGHKSSWCVPCDNVGTVGRESVEYRRNYDKPLVAIGGHRQQSKRDKVGAEAKRFEFMTLFHSLSSGSLYPPTKCVGYGMLRPNTLI